MMKLSISRCAKCQKIRLVDRINNRWICFACKQKENGGKKKGKK